MLYVAMDDCNIDGSILVRLNKPVLELLEVLEVLDVLEVLEVLEV